MTTSMTPTEIARRDFRNADYEEDWRSVEVRYPDFSDYDVQQYLEGIKIAYRQQIFNDAVIFA